MEKMIYIVGIGPGNLSQMTEEAKEALNRADVIVGYGTYIDLVKPHFGEKEFAQTPMRQEIERCRMCYEFAKEGKNVALICSGDAGVYGMAAPMYELFEEYEKKEEYKQISLMVIGGVTAANSGAAVLGAPLNHDYCVISLSDLLTPWETIEKRLKAAAYGDFSIVLYNPSSHKRRDYLKRACEILEAAGVEENRACGLVENIGREGQRAFTCTFSKLKNTEVNMFTTVYIGNGQTKIKGDKLITPRGYRVS